MSASEPRLAVLPGQLLVLFLVQVAQGPLAVLAFPPAQFLHGLAAASALCSFSTLHRAEPTPEELLPWAGNV